MQKKQCKKNEIFMNFPHSFSVNDGRNFNMWHSLYGERLHSKFGPIRLRHHKVTYAWNITTLFLSIYSHGLHATHFFWAAQHITMCLDIHCFLFFSSGVFLYVWYWLGRATTTWWWHNRDSSWNKVPFIYTTVGWVTVTLWPTQ